MKANSPAYFGNSLIRADEHTKCADFEHEEGIPPLFLHHMFGELRGIPTTGSKGPDACRLGNKH